ncbi:MAG: phosphohistidine phosphatase SixA [Verrucomicrobia bacterium RIFCSPLOWO2_12_FULL_64_8]|nr:MAG: phosphohistidine phosphatase SixA [Verrucomicrobia bacterium RIFCSPLOWO2_12_FULL_64_8]
MKLFLVRHAHALADEQDAQRPLSARGREVTRLAAAFFRANGLLTAVHAVWHSPLRRARETAELLVKELGLDAPLVETAGLLPSDDPAVMADRLEHMDRSVMIVGHEPHLSALATLLVRSKVKPVAFDLRKGAVLALETAGGRHKKSDRARWRVCWHFSPELLPGGGN